MKLNRFLLYAAGAMILSVASACSDDKDDWPTVDGQTPTLKMASTLVGCRAGGTFHINNDSVKFEVFQSWLSR